MRHSRIQLLDLCQEAEWITVRHSIRLPGLTVVHGIQEAGEIEVAGFTDHIVGIFLNSSNRRHIIQIGNQEWSGNCPKGASWLIPANVSGIWRWQSADEGLKFIVNPNFLYQIAHESCRINVSNVELVGIPFVMDAQLQTLGQLFLREMNTGGIGGRLYSESLANIFMLHLLRHYGAFPAIPQHHTGGLSSVQLQQVIDYLNTHLERTIRLSDLATIVGVSQHHFCRLFKQSVGMTPHQYLLRQRIARAKQLLKQRMLSIAQVSQLVGFVDQSHFTNQFKRIVGVTPKEFIE